MIRDEMEKEEGWSWDLRIGFHAVRWQKILRIHFGRD